MFGWGCPLLTFIYPGFEDAKSLKSMSCGSEARGWLQTVPLKGPGPESPTKGELSKRLGALGNLQEPELPTETVRKPSQNPRKPLAPNSGSERGEEVPQDPQPKPIDPSSWFGGR